MPKVRLSLPVDSTFLSSVIYEGLLYLIPEYSKNFSLRDIDFEADFLKKAYSQLEEERIAKITINTVGRNDENFVKSMGGSANNYSNLFMSTKASAETFNSKEKINLNVKFTTNSIKIDLEKGDEEVTSPQLFKIDRYTGFSSLETPYTSKKLTPYFSKEVALISLLGIYSAFVISTGQQQQSHYYFLFFSPDETLKLLASGNKDLVKAYLQIKDKAREMLSEIVAKYYSNELLIAEVALNVEIRNLLRKENLDKISLLLFKIAPEGKTYKIYEVIPLDFFSETKFDVISRHFRDQKRLIETLRDVISPRSIVLEALASMNRQNRYAEAENILSAVQGIYRFVILGDSQGFFEFTQKLSEAVRKLENSNDKRERQRAKEYKNLLSKLSFT